jgi:hypothetical protein
VRPPLTPRPLHLVVPLLVAAAALAVPAADAQIQPTGCFTAPRVTASTSWPLPTRAPTGERDTSPDLALDGDDATWFQSNHDSWQYLEVDFGCVGILRGMNRLMSHDGRTDGTRPERGEGLSYSADGQHFPSVGEATTSGWERHGDYSPVAWNRVPYGWSGWLVLDEPVPARYVRFIWDGAGDALNDLELDWERPT